MSFTPRLNIEDQAIFRLFNNLIIFLDKAYISRHANGVFK